MRVEKIAVPFFTLIAIVAFSRPRQIFPHGSNTAKHSATFSFGTQIETKEKGNEKETGFCFCCTAIVLCIGIPGIVSFAV